jgi:hypothetical protein
LGKMGKPLGLTLIGWISCDKVFYRMDYDKENG